MKSSFGWSALALAVVVIEAACAAHQEPFNEAEFSSYARSGTGVVDGRVFRVGSDDEVYTRKDPVTVELFPANAYTDEIVRRKFKNRVWLSNPAPAFAKYVRKTQTDNSGNFIFRHVAPGNYYVVCHYEWTYPTTTTDADGATVSIDAADDQWLWNQTYVKNGERTTVTGWDQGK